MTIQEQFVTYEIALKLKELGFDEECFGFYNHNGMLFYQCIAKQYDGYIDITKVNFEIYKEDIGAPLWQQVQSFLDDNGVIIGIIFVDNVFKYTLNTNNYVSNEFKDRMSTIKSATEYATNYLWDKKFNK